MESLTTIFQYQQNKPNTTEDETKQVVDDKVKLHINYIEHKIEINMDYSNRRINNMIQSNNIVKNMEKIKTNIQ